MVTLLQSHSSELVKVGARARGRTGEGGGFIRESGKSFILLIMSKQNPVFTGIVLLDKVMMLSTRMGMNKAYDNVDNVMQIHQSVVSVIRISSLILITIRSTA